MIAATRCPDCDSDTDLVEHAPGVWLAEVRHDETCPWFRDYQARTIPGSQLHARRRTPDPDRSHLTERKTTP